MSFFASLFTAFAMYSKIPVPQLDWDKKHLRYAIGLFPLVGAVIGALSYAFVYFTRQLEPSLAGFPRAAVFALISLLISGGIHVDGYLDTSDALSSFGEREKKLKILSDPHIGSFAVIRLLCYYLPLLAAYTLLDDLTSWLLCSVGFYLSRILSGTASTWCKSATKEGTLFTFTDNAQKTGVRLILALQLVLCLAFMLYVSPGKAAFVIVANALLCIWWRYTVYSNFGGITGDTAGFLSTLSEGATAVALAVSLWFV